MSATKETWPRVRLGEVCEIVLGGTPKTTIDGYWNGVIPWITPGEMGKISGPYVSDTKRKLTAEGLAAGSRLFPEKSVILSTRAPIGYVFINAVPMCTNQGCKTLVPSDRLLAEYLYWNLRGRTDELNQLGTGTTFKELSTIALKSIELPLPPLSTQREIVARLEKELGQVDELAKKFAELETTAEAEFKATLAEEMERLTHAATVPDVADIPGRPSPATRKGGDGTSRTNGTTGTQMVKLGEVSEEIHERIPSSSVAIDGYITTDNMLKNCAGVCVAEYVPKGVSLVRYQRNDVLMANIRPYLRKLWRADREGGCSSDVVVFRSTTPDLSPEYLFASLSQDRFFDYVMQKPRGTKMPRGDREWMKNFELPLPPRPTQRAIVARLDAAKARKEALVDAAKRGLAEAAQMRKAILKEAFE